MSDSAVLANCRWEIMRLIRSQRIFLLSIPPVAGPIGSAIAFLYFHVQSHEAALVLGLIVTAGLGTLVMLDLAALSAGEELSRKAHFTMFTLPQERWAMLSGRIIVVFGSSITVFSAGAALIFVLSSALVPGGSSTITLNPIHMFEGLAVMLVFLGAVALTASIITRSSSEALVAGILSAVVTVALAGYFLLKGELTMLFPAVLGLASVAAFGWSFYSYSVLES